MSFVALYGPFIPYVVALLAHLAGFIVAVILLVRARGRAAVLAMVGFVLLTLISLGQIVLALPPVTRELFRPGQRWLIWLPYCCCGLLDLVAIACLIVAIWQAVSAAEAGRTVVGVDEVPPPVGDDGVEEMVGEYMEGSEEAGEESG